MRFQKITRQLLYGLAVAAFAAPVTLASITTFSDRAAWEAAISGEQIVTFDGITAPNTATDFSTGSSFTQKGATFTGYWCVSGNCNSSAPNAESVIDPTINPAQYDLGSGPDLFGLADYGFSGTDFGFISILLPSGQTAFGVNYAGYLTNPNFNLLGYTPMDILVQAYDASSNLIGSATVAVPDRTGGATSSFVGLTSTTPVSFVDLRAVNPDQTGNTFAFPMYDNVSFGVADVATPEPSTAILMLAGFAVWMALRGRKRTA